LRRYRCRRTSPAHRASGRYRRDPAVVDAVECAVAYSDSILPPHNLRLVGQVWTNLDQASTSIRHSIASIAPRWRRASARRRPTLSPRQRSGGQSRNDGATGHDYLISEGAVPELRFDLAHLRVSVLGASHVCVVKVAGAVAAKGGF